MATPALNLNEVTDCNAAHQANRRARQEPKLHQAQTQGWRAFHCAEEPGVSGVKVAEACH